MEKTPQQRAQACLDEVGLVVSGYGLSSNDKAFLRNIANWRKPTITEGQDKYLKDLEGKIFLKEESDEDENEEEARLQSTDRFTPFSKR